jgi:tight adherence protein C
MVGPLLVFGMLGGSVLLLIVAVSPPRVDLAAKVGQWDARRAHPTPRGRGEDVASLWSALVGRLEVALARRGIGFNRLRPDLEILGRSLEQHLSAKLMWALGGLLAPNVIVAVWWSAGLVVPLAVPAAGSLLLAAAGFMVPDLAVATAATQRRADLRRVLSCYLDLVHTSLAGGQGIGQSLERAAHVGTGWGFDMIQASLQHAKDSGTSEWEAFAELGKRTRMPELVELGGALGLVADEGSKVRASLAARASTLRKRRLAEMEGEAKTADQSMLLAQLVLAVGLMLFIGYPAMVAATSF